MKLKEIYVSMGILLYAFAKWSFFRMWTDICPQKKNPTVTIVGLGTWYEKEIISLV